MKKTVCLVILILVIVWFLPGYVSAADKTPPQLVSASVNKDKIKLTYNEGLSLTQKPEPSAYSVKVNGVVQAVPKSISMAARTVTITLAAAVKFNDSGLLSYQPSNKYVSDLAGNRAASFVDYALTNSTPDKEAPILKQATINENNLSLIYNENLNTGSCPAASKFSVKIGSAASINPTSVSISVQQVNLSLATAAKPKESVTLSYSVPVTNPIKDSAGNKAAALTNQAVTNLTQDLIAPELKQANVNGDQLNLLYSETLKGSSVPSGNDFVIMQDDTPQSSPVKVTISQQMVTLTLAQAVLHENAITITYTPGTSPIQDLYDNNAAALSGQAVINNTPDVNPPVIKSNQLIKDKLQLEYNEDLDPGSVPANTDYQIVINQKTPESPAAVSLEGKTITCTLAQAVNPGDKATLSYTPGSSPVKDKAGNPAAALLNLELTNNTIDDIPPEIISSTANRAIVILKYNEALNAGSIPITGDYTITVNGNTAANPKTISLSGSQVKITLTSPITYGDTVTLSYTPGSNPIKDQCGNPAAALVNLSLENNMINIKHDYIYDRSNRMIKLNSSQSKNYQYQYDNNGNLQKKANP